MIAKFTTLLFATLSLAFADNWADHYSIENISVPPTVDPQLGGITTTRDGRLAICSYGGEVMLYEPTTKKWSLFAQGLHCPLGIMENDDGSFLVMQWAELTRLSDTDKDGVADHYQTICDDFGISGNYHEFAYGPVRDSKGNLYISLNVASNGAGIFKNVRGPFSPVGLARERLTLGHKNPDWKDYKAQAGRMYSRVPYRGCILKITPDGKSTPFAYGLRSPDGLCIDEHDRLWVTDNQGDWRGTSPLYQVTEGGFYGHPASLTWLPGFTEDPLKVSVEKLQKMRTPAAGLFPHGELANSPTQPINTIDPALFGLPKGELLIGDMNQPTLIRFLPEKVDGTVQGAMIPFLFSMNMGIGNHRFTFTEDGSLWIAKTHLKWAGSEGMQKVTWNKKPIFLADGARLKKDGFEITFNHPLDEKAPDVKISKHTYHYHGKYGSEKVDLKTVPVTASKISDDRRSLKVTLPDISPGYLYTIELAGAKDSNKRPLMGDVIRYNVVKRVPAK